MGWNYNKSSQVKTLATLIDTYHQSVGHGGTLEIQIDFDPLTGAPVPSRVARLTEFGDWIRACYKTTPVATSTGSWELRLQVPVGVTVDRIVLEEDLSFGQRIRSYEVLGTLEGGAAVTRLKLSNGTAVGSKKIDLFNVTSGQVISEILVNVTTAAAVPHLTASVFRPCPSQ